MNLLKEHYQSDDAITYEMTDGVIKSFSSWHKKNRLGPFTIDSSTIETIYDEENPTHRKGFKFLDTTGKERELSLAEWYALEYKLPYGKPFLSVLVEYGKRPEGLKKLPSNRIVRIAKDSENFVPVLVKFFNGYRPKPNIESPLIIPEGSYYKELSAVFKIWSNTFTSEVKKYFLEIQLSVDALGLQKFENIPDENILWELIQMPIRHEFTHLMQHNVFGGYSEKAPRGQNKEWSGHSDDEERRRVSFLKKDWLYNYELIPSEIEANLEACMSIARKRGFPLADVLFDYFTNKVQLTEDHVIDIIDKYREYAERNYPEYETF